MSLLRFLASSLPPLPSGPVHHQVHIPPGTCLPFRLRRTPAPLDPPCTAALLHCCAISSLFRLVAFRIRSRQSCHPTPWLLVYILYYTARGNRLCAASYYSYSPHLSTAFSRPARPLWLAPSPPHDTRASLAHLPPPGRPVVICWARLPPDSEAPDWLTSSCPPCWLSDVRHYLSSSDHLHQLHLETLHSKPVLPVAVSPRREYCLRQRTDILGRRPCSAPIAALWS